MLAEFKYELKKGLTYLVKTILVMGGQAIKHK
jgi:hypothetical protein